MKCNESDSDIMCREDFVEDNPDETLKKKGIVCY